MLLSGAEGFELCAVIVLVISWTCLMAWTERVYTPWFAKAYSQADVLSGLNFDAEECTLPEYADVPNACNWLRTWWRRRQGRVALPDGDGSV